MKRALRGREIAIGDIDRDALFALGLEPVHQQREVDIVAVVPKRRESALERFELIVENQPRLVEQAADQRRFAVIDRAASQQSQQDAGVRADGRRLICDRRRASEIALALLLFHRAGFVVIDQPALPLRGARAAHFGDHLGERRGLRTRSPRSADSSRACGTGPCASRGISPGRSGSRSSSTMIQSAVALDDGPLLGKIERHDGNVLGRDVVPDVEFGPVGQRKHPHRSRLARSAC